MALTTDKLDQSVSSELPGNPPLWIARRDASAYQYDLYVNDARVIRGDVKAMSSRQDEQVRRLGEMTISFSSVDLSRLRFLSPMTQIGLSVSFSRDDTSPPSFPYSQKKNENKQLDYALVGFARHRQSPRAHLDVGPRSPTIQSRRCPSIGTGRKFQLGSISNQVKFCRHRSDFNKLYQVNHFPFHPETATLSSKFRRTRNCQFSLRPVDTLS